MKTMALTEEMLPRELHSKIRWVVSWSLPQSSAFMIRTPAWRDALLFPTEGPSGTELHADLVCEGPCEASTDLSMRFASALIVLVLTFSKAVRRKERYVADETRDG
jgi:hypothetical protein